MMKQNIKNEEQAITLYENDLYEQQEVKEESAQLVVFRLSEEWYGIDISKTKEVLTIDKITFLPSTPAHIAGIVSLRGNILSVIDIKRIFDMPQEELTKKARIIVVYLGEVETGVLVDEVDKVLEVPISQIEPTLSTILNIINNAIDAMEKSTKKELHIQMCKRENFLDLSIVDSGCGIPENYLNKIYLPFFTTKETNKGTGLGLSVCVAIIEDHGGKLSVESKVGYGTKFMISLPLERIKNEVI